jgi:hypothetical protein
MPNILARKLVEGPLPFCNIEAKSEGYNQAGPLVSEYFYVFIYCIILHLYLVFIFGIKVPFHKTVCSIDAEYYVYQI